MSRRFVSEHRDQYPTKRLLRGRRRPKIQLQGVGSRPLSDHDLDDAWLANEIYQASRRTYGSPRFHGQSRNAGERHDRKRVARIMAECDLVGAHEAQVAARPTRHRAGVWSHTESIRDESIRDVYALKSAAGT